MRHRSKSGSAWAREPRSIVETLNLTRIPEILYEKDPTFVAVTQCYCTRGLSNSEQNSPTGEARYTGSALILRKLPGILMTDTRLGFLHFEDHVPDDSRLEDGALNFYRQNESPDVGEVTVV